jgi:1-pyrroline-5-carboxylate dehydrogenase
MFERYTEKARRVIFFGRYEASTVGSKYIESEHLLMGLLREDKAMARRIAGSGRAHEAVEAIRSEVHKFWEARGTTSTSVDLRLSEDSKLVLRYSAEEAEGLKHRHIGTEHLLLGMLRTEGCFAQKLLIERGVKLGELREELRKITAEQLAREERGTVSGWMGTAKDDAEVRGAVLGELRRTVQRHPEEPAPTERRGMEDGVVAGFENEAFLDFGEPRTRRAMEAALAEVGEKLGREYEMVVGGRRVKTKGKIVSLNPARPAEVVGVHQAAGEEHVEEAVRAAQAAFVSWSRVGMEERAALLFRVAGLVRLRKFEMCAWLVYEVGKNWVEADADVGETIDFLEFYGRSALRLAKARTPIQFPGEKNELRYLPLGVGAVIPPWNFPLAIMAGMTAAAIVCGNTVILKPSVDAPTIAAKFFELLAEAGMPEGVVNFCPGAGPGFGSGLVAHPEVRFVAFTGSKKVGLEIHESAAKTRPGQRFIKRTILEMGGKDSIVVEPDCDLDAAADGVVASAFGFSGQKCSACSRVIVDERVYAAFCERLVERVKAIQQGDPAKNCYAGPVISRTAYERVLGYVEVGKMEGRLLCGGSAVEDAEGGYYIAPTVFADVSPTARIAQEEIFGPVLAVIRSKGFEEALAIANNTEYGLTGAVYTSSREKLERAREEFHVGNLYFNRKCTGAMVGAHPFGGFNMSGTDSKAGGADYLLLFTQAKSIAEKVGMAGVRAEEQEERMGL